MPQAPAADDPMTPNDRMLLSLNGLSVGDAFGERCFDYWYNDREAMGNRIPPPPPWLYTDDTEMALSIVDVLRRLGHVDPDVLAAEFARRYDPSRGYGSGARELLEKLRAGAGWRQEAPAMFDGTGSYGNGAAMRVAPLGAFFAGDLDRVIENAALSAQPTHAHCEGVAGAIAVALGAAFAWRITEGERMTPNAFLTTIAARLPACETRDGINVAAELPSGTSAPIAAALLGSGQRVSAQDTVPFALWSAAHSLGNYTDALWNTAAGLGDVDTTCAMVGGIVALSAREQGIPPQWIKAREPLPEGF